MKSYYKSYRPYSVGKNTTFSFSPYAKYWSVSCDNSNPLRTIDRVFDRFGYLAVNAAEGDDWDVLWSIDYPFGEKRSKIFNSLNNPMKEHQKVNHFPGINSLTEKTALTTGNRDMSQVLQGFVLPKMTDELQSYLKANPNARFIEKSPKHQVKLVKQSDIKFDKSEKYYQRYLENPFLVDGHVMHFGVYALITSIDPLRIYRFQEVDLRFSLEPYVPFDPKIVDKFVISDKYQEFLQLPQTKSYFDHYGNSFQLAMEAYFENKGKNTAEMWMKIDKSIGDFFFKNEKHLVTEVSDC